MKKNSGFTLIELLVVIGILAILAGVVIVAVNPGRQFALTRNTNRQSHVTQILSAIQQNKVEHSGNFTCGGVTTPLPAAPINMGSNVPPAGTDFDIAPCIVDTYIPALPFDPSVNNSEHYTTTTDYNTGYDVSEVGGRVTVSAPDTELGVTVISQTQ